MKYFSYDPQGDGFDFHETAEQARDQAQQCIQIYLDDGWDDMVEQVCWGEIKEIATKTNVRPIDENGRLPDGEFVGYDFEYYCNYELKKLEQEHGK